MELGLETKSSPQSWSQLLELKFTPNLLDWGAGHWRCAVGGAGTWTEVLTLVLFHVFGVNSGPNPQQQWYFVAFSC